MFLTKPRAGPMGGDRSPWGNFWFAPVPAAGFSTPEKAMALTAVYACVKVLAESFAVMPFLLYKPSADGTKRKQIRDHWSVRIFTRSPNRFQTPFEWRMMLMGHLALRGNAFCEVRDDGRGNITELLPLHPDKMSVEMLTGGNYRYKYLTDQGDTVYYKRGEIWHLRGMSSDGILGISPLEACRGAVAEGLAMQSYSNRFFENDAKPGGGWVEFPGSFASTAAKQEFRDSWHKLQGGANRGKVAVLEKGMKFHELAASNTDSQLAEIRAAKVSDIARIYRIPPHMIGDLSRATFSNIEQQSIEFWTNTMLPWAEMWESSIEYFLLGEDTKYEVEFDMQRMLRGDSAARTAYYSQGIVAGWLTRNEAREMEGLAPLDELDEPLVPLNMIPADKLDEQAEQPDPGAAPPPDEPKPGKAPPKDARTAALVVGACYRMARRMAGGSTVSGAALAEALAIEPARAALWLAEKFPVFMQDEAAIAGSLLEHFA